MFLARLLAPAFLVLSVVHDAWPAACRGAVVCLIAYNPGGYRPSYRAFQSVYRMLSVGAMPGAIAFGGAGTEFKPVDLLRNTPDLQ